MTDKIYLLAIATFIFSCSTDIPFDSRLWRSNEKQKYYMLDDIVHNKKLLGKSEAEIIRLLDTVDVKQYHYNDRLWMYIVEKPFTVRSTDSPVAVMDIEFTDDSVTNVELRK